MTKITDKVSKKLNSLTSKPTTRSATSGPTQDNQTQGHVLDDSALIPPESGPAIQTEESGCRPGFTFYKTSIVLYSVFYLLSELIIMIRIILKLEIN